ncbi:MAG TPA: hypothetical protein VHQ47_15035, partial [Phycisphaerae bacterium]|nr:hypothetical protein [Phycisphaerae bacterium]
MIVAGIDEAGYGPLLGPLVVSAAGFELAGVALDVEAELGGAGCLWKLLKGAVAKKAPAKKGRVLVADSKIVHAQAEGVRLLERGVLAFFGQTQKAKLKMQNRGEADDGEGMGVREGGSAAADMRAGSPRYDGGMTARGLVELLGCCEHGLGEHPWYGEGGQGARVPW